MDKNIQRFSELKVMDLKIKAKEYCIPQYYKMKKNMLIHHIIQYESHLQGPPGRCIIDKLFGWLKRYINPQPTLTPPVDPPITLNVFQPDDYINLQKVNRIIVPKKGTYLKFKNYIRTHKVPFVIYADFTYIPFSFCFYIKCFDDKIFSKEPITYIKTSSSENIYQTFIDMVEIEIKSIYQQFQTPPVHIITSSEHASYIKERKCWLCNEEYSVQNNKTQNYCYYTGKYNGSSHISCDLKYSKLKTIPILFNNLNKQSIHSFIKTLKDGIKCIPTNDDNFTGFTKNVLVDDNIYQPIRFLDFHNFIEEPLDVLVKDKLSELKITRSFYSHDHVLSLYSNNDYKEYLAYLNIRKGHGDLSHIVHHEQYNTSCSTWGDLKMTEIKHYYQVYNKFQVLLLVDVFEKFRSDTMKTYGLDSAWYFTLSGLSWDACLKITKVELELLSDKQMILMFEKSIRDHMSFKNLNDIKLPTNSIHLKANHLHSWAMNQLLPISHFQWMSNVELKNWINIPCILNVTLEYPHPFENKYLNLNSKSNYIIHHENLKLYQHLGVKIVKIHKGIKFKESNWLHPYINFQNHTMNKHIFNKSIENLKDKLNIQLVNDHSTVLDLSTKPNFSHCTTFNDNVFGVYFQKMNVIINKPIYLGMCILEMEKMRIYDLHYNYMKQKYNNNCQLLYSDNTKLIYYINTENFYSDIIDGVDKYFDTTDDSFQNMNKDGYFQIQMVCK